MSLISKIRGKEFLILGVFFLLLFLSYTTNLLRITPSDLFHGFERQPEGLVVGRLVRSSHEGIFSKGGLTGVNYDSSTERTPEQYAVDLAAQHDLYLLDKTVPDSYQAYKSQSGGQALVFSVLQEVIPASSGVKLMIFRAFNALLVALVFVLFGGWIYRNFGAIAGSITLLLILYSSWLNMYAHNLWWVLWNFYLPFITVLLVLEQRHKEQKKYTDTRIMIYLFIAVFAKCFFTGFEFITTSLVAAFCPIVYYYLLEKKSFRDFFIFSFKAGVTMILAVLAQMMMLVTQIKALEGHFSDGINHIVESFTKRTETAEASLWEVVMMYLKGDFLNIGGNMYIYFGVLFLIFLVLTLIVSFLQKNNNHIKALAITFGFSVLAPLSWLIIFKQHSFEHPHMDYIVWYIPFILYGYSIVGILVASCFKKSIQ